MHIFRLIVCVYHFNRRQTNHGCKDEDEEDEEDDDDDFCYVIAVSFLQRPLRQL